MKKAKLANAMPHGKKSSIKIGDRRYTVITRKNYAGDFIGASEAERRAFVRANPYSVEIRSANGSSSYGFGKTESQAIVQAGEYWECKKERNQAKRIASECIELLEGEQQKNKSREYLRGFTNGITGGVMAMENVVDIMKIGEFDKLCKAVVSHHNKYILSKFPNAKVTAKERAILDIPLPRRRL